MSDNKGEKASAAVKRLLKEGGTGEEILRHLPMHRTAQLMVAPLGSGWGLPRNEHFYPPADIRKFFGLEQPKPKSERPGSQGKGGRPPGRFWPVFAEELAVYFALANLPPGKGGDGTKEVYDAVAAKMATRTENVPEFNTVQPVIKDALTRVRK